jgi:hypothetical protein
MRVLYISPDSMLGRHFRRGWERAFTHLGLDFVNCRPIAGEVANLLCGKPFDLVLAASGEGIDLLPVDQLNECGTALVVNGLPFNRLRISPDIQAPLANAIEVALIAKFNKKLVWSQWEIEFVKDFFSGYVERGIRVISMPYAGDAFEYRELVEPEFDITFVGNLRHRRNGNLSLFKNLFRMARPGRLRLVGGDDWMRYLGVAAQPMSKEENPADSYCRAIISPNIHTKRQRDHALQLNDRVFQIPASGGFQICDNQLARRYFNANELLVADNEDDFLEITDYFLKNPDKRISYIHAGSEAITVRHSYVNRVKKLLHELEFDAIDDSNASEMNPTQRSGAKIYRMGRYFVESRVMDVAHITRGLRKKWMP